MEHEKQHSFWKLAQGLPRSFSISSPRGLEAQLPGKRHKEEGREGEGGQAEVKEGRGRGGEGRRGKEGSEEEPRGGWGKAGGGGRCDDGWFSGEGSHLPEARLSHQHKALRFNCQKCRRERNEI